MKACNFVDFIDVLKPWLNDDYIRKAGLDENGRFRLQLTDGGVKNYRVDGCTKDQIKDVMEMLAAKGIPVEKI